MRVQRNHAARAATILALAVLAVGCKRSEPARRTNVVLITLDTLRADHLASYGYTRETMPALDRFGAEGVRFENAVTATTLTAPSHATILTGLHPAGHGVVTNGWVLHPKALTLAEVLGDLGYRTGAFVAARWVLGSRFGFDQGFEVFREGETDQRRADVVTTEALEYIEAVRGEAFFAWIHYYDAHCDYDPPGPFDIKFTSGVDSALDPDGKCGKTFYNRTELSEADVEKVRGSYDGELAYLDSQLQVLFDRLAELRLLENTLFVITADHGEALHDRGRIGHNLTLNEWETHVPLWFRAPGLAPASVEAVVSTADLAPTILQLLDLPPLPDVDGAGLLPVLLQGATPRPQAPRTVFSRQSAETGFLDQAAIREGSWKLLATADGAAELHDLAVDPRESVDVAAQRPEIRERLGSLLRDWRALQERRLDSDQEVPDEVKDKLRSLGYLN